MLKNGNLTPEEMSKAVTLAAELREQDTEHESIIAATEEVGVPAEYMAQAMARIRAEKVKKKAARQKRLQAAVAALCFVVVYCAAQSIARSLRTPVQSAPKPIFSLSQFPTDITQIPFSIGTDLTTEGMNEKYPTTIDFHNKSGTTVQLYQLGAEGERTLVTTLAPAGTIKESTWFTHPWLVTDLDQDSLGVVYPTAKPNHVDLEPPTDLRGMGQQGYDFPLRSDAAGAVHASSPGLQTEIEFVNMSGHPVDLYRLSWDGKRQLAATLENGAAIFEGTVENDRWLADNDLVQDTFKPDLIPNIALISSGDRAMYTNSPSTN